MNELLMPLLDIAIAKPSFQSHCCYTRLQFCINGKATNYYLLQDVERWTSLWKFSLNPKKMSIHMGCHKKLPPKFLVKAVATLEPKISVQSEDGGKENGASLSIDELESSTVHVESSDTDSKEIDAREKLRRMRISKANKGKTPWNKGRQHNPAKLESSTVHFESSDADSEEIDAREKLRRMRISKANKGKLPWNKGRKHSPETLQRISERTKLAMQNPKVRMKLVLFSRPQSQETRDKIGEGVRMSCENRLQRQKMQESCLFDWQNLIAEAAKRGFHGEEELQWNSYEILDKQLQEEWLHYIEYRKRMARPKSSNRAPKSLEHRRKIADAIAAKWSDPEYRARVASGVAKYRGKPDRAERKMKKKANGEGQCRKTPKEKVRKMKKKPSDEVQSRKTPEEKVGKVKKKPSDEVQSRKTPEEKVGKVKKKPSDEASWSQQPKVKKGYVLLYKDPSTRSKLKMLKSIRAQRLASQTKTNETLERAKVMVAEAKKAAKALEVVARRSPVAQASLIEARKLIVEATQTIENIENGEIGSLNQSVLTKDPGEAIRNGVNGIASSLQSSQGQNSEFNLYRLTMQDKMGMSSLPTRLGGYKLHELENDNSATPFGADQGEVCRDVSNLIPASRGTEFGGFKLDGVAKLNGSSTLNGAKVHIHEGPAAKTLTKKWVRGRLVEVIEGKN